MNLMDYLETLARLERYEAPPAWIYGVNMFDDVKQKHTSEICRREVERQNALIAQANAYLERNSRYKSILHTEGDELVEVVIEMLEWLLGRSSDKDVEAGFKIKLEDVTFIGKITGTDMDVKTQHILSVINDREEYIGELKEHGEKENVKGLLIINHQRSKAPQEREIIDDYRIDLTTRNKLLIIETPTLLKLFERYINGEVERDECRALFRDKVGVLELDE